MEVNALIFIALICLSMKIPTNLLTVIKFKYSEKATKFSDSLGLNHNKKAKKLKHVIHLGLAQGPQSFATYRSI